MPQISRMVYPPYSMSAQHHMNVYYPQHPQINLYHQQAHHQRQGTPTQMPHHATTQSKSQNVNPHQVHSRQTNNERVKDTTNVETHISRTKSTNGTLELNAPVRQNDQPKVQISQDNHRDHEVANKNPSGSISIRIQDNGNASIDIDKSKLQYRKQQDR